MQGGRPETDWPAIYRQRRNAIREAVGKGVLLWLGHLPQPRNYWDNTYPFRQNSHFLYYTGLDEPDLAVLSYPDRTTTSWLRPVSLDEVVWSGAGHTRVDMARQAGIDTVEDIGRLGVYLPWPAAMDCLSTTFRRIRLRLSFESRTARRRSFRGLERRITSADRSRRQTALDQV